jgi:hypothetical protein
LVARTTPQLTFGLPPVPESVRERLAVTPRAPFAADNLEAGASPDPGEAAAGREAGLPDVEAPVAPRPVLGQSPIVSPAGERRAEIAAAAADDRAQAADVALHVASPLPEPATPAQTDDALGETAATTSTAADAQRGAALPTPAQDLDPAGADAAVPVQDGAQPGKAARPGRWVTVPAATEPERGDARGEAPADDGLPALPTIRPALPVLPDVPSPGDFAALLPFRLTPSPAPASAADMATAAAFADTLARQVGRGIAQGVVDAAVAAGSLPVTDPPPRPDASAGAEALSAPPAVAPSPPDPLDQIEIATALDRARAQERRLDLPVEAQAACRDEAQFDTAAWVEEPGTLPDFAARRGAVVGEFDRVDPEALAAAVRYHVAYGFGAEARQLLTAFGTPPPLPAEEVEVLQAMSHIVDGEAGDVSAALAGQIVCRSRAALWGALARPELSRDADYSAPAILSAFEELPTELRRSLGPDLANRFLQIGDLDTVAGLRRSIERIDPPDDAATELAREPGALLDARLEAAEGRVEQSETRLADVARLDGPLAPEAVAELIESRLDRGELPDDALVASAAALAMEGRGSDVGARLRRSEILALVARDDFDRARDELRRATAGAEIGAAARAEIADAYVAAVSARAPDRAFLARLPRETAELLGHGLSPDTRRGAAERLLALGLPEAALPLVDDLASDADARLVAARAWLRLDQAGTALARVAGLEGPDAERVRAEAYEALGDPGTAARVLDSLGDGEAAVAAAWRAGDLDRVSRDPGAPRAQIADLARSEDPRAPDTLAPLAEHRDLIADIARRLEAIASELARP